MLKGESGLLSIFPPKSQIKARLIRKDNIPMVTFTKGKETIAEAYIYTGEEPERLRGPQHDFAWVDEVAAFRYLQEVWELFIAGLRLGESKAIFTTTPKSKLLSIKGFLDSPRAVITFGESKENANNVSKGFMDSVLAVYEGSSREDEELKGKIRLDESGALFKQAWLIRNRVTSLPLETVNVRNPVNGHLSPSQIPAIQKYVIAIDPSGSDKKTACECGIVLVALGKDGNAYLIKDLSKRDVPENWARIALQAAYEYNAEIAFEKNYGGDLVPTVISLMAKNMNKQTPKLIPLQASKDKHSRAVPVSALVSKNKVKFVGYFDELERQLTTWTPEDTKSPDRLDAFVWAITHLLVKLEPARGIIQQPLMNF
jgi:phage terminase large subunit-like protein